MKLNRRGDTIVEVLLAMTVLSAILFISWGLTNRTTQINLAARTRIEMVNQLKEQAEIIKTRHNNGGATFPSGMQPADSLNVAGNGVDPCTNINFVDSMTPVGGRAYAFNKPGQGINPHSGVKRVANDSTRLVWVQYKNGSGFRDYFIRACWQTSGRQNTDNSQIIMRLNNNE